MRAHFTGTETANAVERHTHRVRRSRTIVGAKRRSAFACTPLFASGNVWIIFCEIGALSVEMQKSWVSFAEYGLFYRALLLSFIFFVR